MQDRQQQLLRDVSKQLDYLRTQFEASLGWRLKQKHTVTLSNLGSVLTPITDVLKHLQEELPHCKITIHTMAEGTASIRFSTTMVNIFVQTYPED